MHVLVIFQMRILKLINSLVSQHYTCIIKYFLQHFIKSGWIFENILFNTVTLIIQIFPLLSRHDDIIINKIYILFQQLRSYRKAL